MKSFLQEVAYENENVRDDIYEEVSQKLFDRIGKYFRNNSCDVDFDHAFFKGLREEVKRW